MARCAAAIWLSGDASSHGAAAFLDGAAAGPHSGVFRGASTPGCTNLIAGASRYSLNLTSGPNDGRRWALRLARFEQLDFL